jgi:hypothetical protein
VSREPLSAELDSQLARLRELGANVLVGCTYYSTAIALVQALERLEWAPHALLVSEAVGNNELYAQAIREGWWQGEYVLGSAAWHKSKMGRGDVSNLTSAEFADRFRRAHEGAEVTYHGAANFAAACALVEAIERADSLETHAVARALRTANVSEFYGPIRFDANHQIAIPMLVAQVAEGETNEDIVYPSDAVTSGLMRFPMPSWAQRRCRAFGPVTVAIGQRRTVRKSECNGQGTCDSDGRCQCVGGWSGAACTNQPDFRCPPGTGTSYLPSSAHTTRTSTHRDAAVR